MASIAYQAHPPTAINLSLPQLDLNVPPDPNGQYHSYSTIHSPRSGSKYISNSEAVSQAVIVPFGWKRELHDSRIVYKSPSDALLWSMEEIARYLMTEGTCKCGLECPFQIDQIFNFDANIRFQKYSTSQPSNDRFCSHKAKLNAIAEYNQHASNHQQAHNNNTSMHLYKNNHQYDHQMNYSHQMHHHQQQQQQPASHHQHSEYGPYESEMSQMQPQQSQSHQMNGYHSFHQMPQSSHPYPPPPPHPPDQQQQLHHQMALNSVNCSQEKRIAQDVTAVTASITEVIPSVGHLIHHQPQQPPPPPPPQPVQYSFIVPQQILVNPILNPVIQSSTNSTPSPVYHHHSLAPQAPSQLPPPPPPPPPPAQQTTAIAMNHMSHMNYDQPSQQPIDLPVDFSKRKVNRKVNGNPNSKGRGKTVAAMLQMDNMPS